MRVLVIEAKERNIHLHDTEGQLHDLQALVGGYIQTGAPAQLRLEGLELLVNEEGLLRGLPVNENLWPFFFVGTAVVVRVKGEEFVSLTDDDVLFMDKWLSGLK